MATRISDNMDSNSNQEEAMQQSYTCFYCHSILPYEVCVSGTHFCLQATNAIEFWGNVVKIASANSTEDQDEHGDSESTHEPSQDDAVPRAIYKVQDEDGNTVELHPDIEDNVEITVFPEMECEDSLTEDSKSTEIKGMDESLDSQDGESDGVKHVNWRLKMISLVKQRPPLYDKRLPLTDRTFPIRAKLWKEVYDGLNGLVPIDLLPKRFKVLRDRYNKEVKRRKLGHPPRKPWSLFKHLEFLSHSKKKMCIRKLGIPNGEFRLEDASEKISMDLKLLSNPSIKMALVDEESYNENLEIKKKFVQMVGERPPLYDCRLPRPVRAAENKVKLWREIYDGLQGAIPLVELPRKFKSLRDRYMKERKKLDNNELSTWPLTEYMTYLDDVAFIRSSQDPLNITVSNDDLSKRLKVEEKKVSAGSEVEGDDAEDSCEFQPSMSPLSNVNSRSPPHRGPPPDLEPIVHQHKNNDEGSVLNRRQKDNLSISSLLKSSPRSPITSSFNMSKVNMVAGQDLSKVGKLKKLELLDAFDNWTEDDFFGAYLVKLMKKLPLDERLRLHTDIINMITQALKNPK